MKRTAPTRLVLLQEPNLYRLKHSQNPVEQMRTFCKMLNVLWHLLMQTAMPVLIWLRMLSIIRGAVDQVLMNGIAMLSLTGGLLAYSRSFQQAIPICLTRVDPVRLRPRRTTLNRLQRGNRQ